MMLATSAVLSFPGRVASTCIRALLLSTLLSTGGAACGAQISDITCDRGNGAFKTAFQTGVTVDVSPAKSGAFATRRCDAKLIAAGNVLEVATSAEQVGIDVLGSDLGFKVPVVAFSIRASNTDTQSEYLIYSLKVQPTLLRTIKGGSSYRASDTNLNGHIEIWTDDTSGVDGFEEIPAADLDFAPTVVLRFEKSRLIDVSSEFRSHFDQQIADVRAHLDQQDLADFRSTDGKLTLATIHSAARLQRLLRVKTRVLEIVWCYLYSDREPEAWQALDAMWPGADKERIHSLLATLRTRGILAQTDGAERKKGSWPLKVHAEIYDITNPDKGTTNELGSSISLAPSTRPKEAAVIEPKSIRLRRPPEPQGSQAQLDANELLELVVDAAGKVHSARVVAGNDPSLLAATKGWQFIPAFRDGEPVACRFRLRVWDLQ
jgi:hypothetical protein